MTESLAILNKYRNKLLNAAVILLTLIIVVNIYKGQNMSLELLRGAKDSELKKNEVLGVIAQAEKRLNTYKNFFNKKDSSLMVNTISNIARDSNVKIIAISPRGQENRQVYTKYPFDLTIGVDSYHAVGKFISNIENSNEVFFIDKVIIKPVEKGPATESKYNLIVSLTISAVSLKN